MAFSRTLTRLGCSLLLLGLAACASPARKASHEDSVRSSRASPRHAPLGPQQGLASWYGKPFHRKRTASGERFDMYALTAAHRTLPFGSKVRVRAVNTGKTVVVRINDRGPWSGGRLIDLSYAAGRELGIVKSGVSKVEIEPLRP